MQKSLCPSCLPSGMVSGADMCGLPRAVKSSMFALDVTADGQEKNFSFLKNPPFMTTNWCYGLNV